MIRISVHGAPGAMATIELLGRDTECGVIDAMLDGVRTGGSHALVIRGEAGIGKSALLDYALARADGLTQLRTSGYESESNIPFAGLSDILRPITEHLDGLPSPQRAALEGTLALGPPATTSHFTVCTATLGLMAAAAEARGVVAVVDDAHWLDPSSAEALRFTARRLHGEGIAMLIAARPTAADHRTDAGIPALQLEGLDYSAATLLLGRQDQRFTSAQTRQLFDVTAGNPLALTEIPAQLDDDAIARGAPLPAGATLERVFEQRLDELPTVTRDALTIAAADQSGELRSITIALDRAGLGIAALEPAEQRGVVTVAGTKVSFQHPLLRSTVYHHSSLASRCAAHRALADAYGTLTGDLAADARAWHVAAATLAPDDHAARMLHDMAERARRRGAHVEAARALERAAALTPDGQARARRLTQAAKAWQLSGRIDRSGALLRDALDVIDDPVARAEIQHLRGYVRMWREAPVGAGDLLEREADAVRDVDPDRAARMLADAAVPAFMTGAVGPALALASDAHTVSRRGGTTTRRIADVTLAVARAIGGDRAGAAALLSPVQAWLAQESPLRRAQEVIFTAMVLVWLEDLAGARMLLDGLISACRRTSALGVLPYALGLSSAIDLRAGRWQQGVASATESVRLAEETHQANTYGVFFLGHLQAAMGQRDDAEHNLDRADQLARTYGIACMPLYTAAARGLLELGAADVDAALTHLEQARTLEERLGVGEPALVLASGDLAEALVRVGRAEEAADLVARALDPSARLGSRWAGWTGARVRGMSDGTLAATSHFEHALALHEKLTWPFEHARTALCFGEVLRRNRRRVEARPHFRLALRTFETLNAYPWAERTRAELRATGERVTAHRLTTGRDVQLTPQELQVALTVADGATNQEAAAALFLSPKTVEYHLSKIYRKAGLSSRDELAALVAAPS